MTQVENLQPVSTTPAANFATSSASVVETGGKFATGVNLELRIFEKIRNGPNGNIRGLEETDSCRKPEVENLLALSL